MAKENRGIFDFLESEGKRPEKIGVHVKLPKDLKEEMDAALLEDGLSWWGFVSAMCRYYLEERKDRRRK